MKITVEEMKRLCEILLETAERSGFQEFELDADYYWLIGSDDREDFSTGEPEVVVGSLREDIESLRKISEGSNPPTTVDFDRLASVLVAVGEHIQRSDKIYYSDRSNRPNTDR